MNLLDVIDEIKHLKLIIHFNQLSDIESQHIDEYRHKIELVHFDRLLVNSSLFIFLDFIFTSKRKLEEKI